LINSIPLEVVIGEMHSSLTVEEDEIQITPWLSGETSSCLDTNLKMVFIDW
jgi:hypothetical protein